MSDPAQHILIVSPNWLGDIIMSLPAIQQFKQENPAHTFSVLVRPGLDILWEMAGFPPGLPPHGKHDALAPAVRQLKTKHIDTAYIIPHSVRSTLLPFLARIPERIGATGHFPRNLLLTQTRPSPPPDPERHQAFELFDLFLPGRNPATLPPPVLESHPAIRRELETRFADCPRPWISLIPGAARGASKQWPADHYSQTARTLLQQTGGTVFLLGTANERPLCQTIADAAGPSARNLAGETTLTEMATLLSLSNAVLCNDSGGMHLAAAVGAPLVAVFGITNPAQTGPLGRAPIRLLQKSTRRTRNIPRNSKEAEDALRAVTPGDALQALLPLLP